MLKGKGLLDYINSFPPKEDEKNNKIRLKYFQLIKRFRWKKSIVLFVVGIENLTTLKYHKFSKNVSSFYICSKCDNEDKIIF